MHSWMFPYVLGYRDRVPFFNTEETLIATQKAIAFLTTYPENKGLYFISQHKSHFWSF